VVEETNLSTFFQRRHSSLKNNLRFTINNYEIQAQFFKAGCGLSGAGTEDIGRIGEQNSGELVRLSGEQSGCQNERLRVSRLYVSRLKLSCGALEEFESREAREARFETLCSQVARLKIIYKMLQSNQLDLHKILKCKAPSLATARKPPAKIDCPFQKAEPLDGIISDLTRDGGRDVHEKVVMTIANDLEVGLVFQPRISFWRVRLG
jgi:hypothetical protein